MHGISRATSSPEDQDQQLAASGHVPARCLRELLLRLSDYVGRPIRIFTVDNGASVLSTLCDGSRYQEGSLYLSLAGSAYTVQIINAVSIEVKTEQGWLVVHQDFSGSSLPIFAARDAFPNSWNPEIRRASHG